MFFHGTFPVGEARSELVIKQKTSVLISTCGDDTKASSRVRAYWVAEELEKLGCRCTLLRGESRMDLLKLASQIPFHKAIVFQKTYSRWHRKLQGFAKLLGKKTFLDLDDAPSRTNNPETLRNIESMFQAATGVFVGSSHLLDYATQFNSNTQLIPSSIKLANYQTNSGTESSHSICLGWIGNGAHYQDDLIQIMKPVLTELARNYEIRFKIVGACEVQRFYNEFGSVDRLEIDFIDQIQWNEPSHVAQSISDFDIGLYPLLPNEFNKFKCGFKALEYMVSGIPVVSSDEAVNADIIVHDQNGLIANLKVDWVKSLKRLIESPAERKRLAKAGRQTVQSEFDVAIAAKRIYDEIMA